MLAGFSQGGAIVLQYALGRAADVAGILALSTYLPLPQRLARDAGSRPVAERPAPLFMAHGIMDNVVPFEAGRQSAALVRELGYPVDWHEYRMGHAVCAEEISDIRAFMLRIFDGGQVQT